MVVSPADSGLRRLTETKSEVALNLRGNPSTLQPFNGSTKATCSGLARAAAQHSKHRFHIPAQQGPGVEPKPGENAALEQPLRLRRDFVILSLPTLGSTPLRLRSEPARDVDLDLVFGPTHDAYAGATRFFDQLQSAPCKEAQNVAASRPERHAHPDFLCTLSHQE